MEVYNRQPVIFLVFLKLWFASVLFQFRLSMQMYTLVLKRTFPPGPSEFKGTSEQQSRNVIVYVVLETKSVHTFHMKNYFNSQDDKNNFVNFVNHCIT